VWDKVLARAGKAAKPQILPLFQEELEGILAGDTDKNAGGVAETYLPV
jgi:hypothetical protein